MEKLRLQSTLSSSNFLHYLLQNTKHFASAIFGKTFWSRCGRRYGHSWGGLPNLQGGSLGGALHPELLYQGSWVLHFLPPMVSTDLISWRPRQKVKAVMEIVRYKWTLKIYILVSLDQHRGAVFDGLHGCLWALLSHKGSLQVQWCQWLPHQPVTARCQLWESTLSASNNTH